MKNFYVKNLNILKRAKQIKMILIVFMMVFGAQTLFADDKTTKTPEATTVLGTWSIDFDAMKKIPEFKTELEKSPEMEKVFRKVFGQMKIIISKTEVKMIMDETEGEEPKIEKGKILSMKSRGNTVFIETEDAKNKVKETAKFIITDKDHIILIDENSSEEDRLPGMEGLPLVRIKQAQK